MLVSPQFAAATKTATVLSTYIMIIHRHDFSIALEDGWQDLFERDKV